MRRQSYREHAEGAGIMTITHIRRALEQALLHDGTMPHTLYVHELEELIDELTVSMIMDHDAFIFAVTENNNAVAMILIEQSGTIFINADARARLRTLWPKGYAQNMKKLIPVFARQIQRNEIPINGVKFINTEEV